MASLKMGRVRAAVASLGLIVTFVLPTLLGSVAAQAYQAGEMQASGAAISKAHRDFGLQASRSLRDGTPKPLLDPIVSEEDVLYRSPLPERGAFVDRLRLLAYRKRSSALSALSSRLQDVETQVEVDLRTQLLTAIASLREDEKPARELGIDTSDYEAFAATTEAGHTGLSTPDSLRAVLVAIQARDRTLKDTTDAKRAAIEAFQRAQADAHSALQRAQAALSEARTITVLKVDDMAAAISALASRLDSATTTADYLGIASGLKIQTSTLDQLLQTRREAYVLRDRARGRLLRAQQGGIDMSSEGPKLDAASNQLDAAGDLDSISAAHDAIQAVKNTIDVKYNLAVYGPGKVIAISLAQQELEALQDGVVLQDTLITSGRSALPTPVGKWTVTNKYTPYHFISPWPKGSPYYYNPSWVSWAMLFHDGGYFIHDAPWRSHYGPGSDSEFGGTHGCVNVPAGSMSWLFGWTDIGTPVDVVADDF